MTTIKKPAPKNIAPASSSQLPAAKLTKTPQAKVSQPGHSTVSSFEARKPGGPAKQILDISVFIPSELSVKTPNTGNKT